MEGLRVVVERGGERKKGITDSSDAVCALALVVGAAADEEEDNEHDRNLVEIREEEDKRKEGIRTMKMNATTPARM